MRSEPIHDLNGDLIASRETVDRALERADSPLTHLDLERIKAHMELLADALAMASIYEEDRL